MSTLPDLQQRVRQIPGVASAIVRWPDPYGPATLKVEFRQGADATRVGNEIMQALVDVGNVDLSSVDITQVPIDAERTTRPIFVGLVLERTDGQLEVEVSLQHAGLVLTGTAEGDSGDELDLVARATLEAVDTLTPHGLSSRAVSILEVADDRLVTSLVDSDREWQSTLSGTAFAADDARQATVRATLDAVNRLIERSGPVDPTT